MLVFLTLWFIWRTTPRWSVWLKVFPKSNKRRRGWNIPSERLMALEMWKLHFLSFFLSCSVLLSAVSTFQKFLMHITFCIIYTVLSALSRLLFVPKHTFWLIQFFSPLLLFSCHYNVFNFFFFFLCNLFCHLICVYTAAEKINMISFPSKWKKKKETKGHPAQNGNECLATRISL